MKKQIIKKIGILTSGGDAPGMNNIIRAVIKYSLINKIEPFLILEGFKGLCEGNIKPAFNNVDQYIFKGGSFIFSSRFPEFKKIEFLEKAKTQINKFQIDALIIVGGNGTQKGTQRLSEAGIKTIFLPGTIDNDVNWSDITVGYYTALNTIIQSVNQIRDTANSHKSIHIIEVMGRHCADLAIFSGLATGAEIIITKEKILSVNEMIEIINKIKNHKKGIIIIISENIYDNLKEISMQIEKNTNIVTRFISLAHLQRGGSPVPQDQIMGTLLGLKSIEALVEGKYNIGIGLVKGRIINVPIFEQNNNQNISTDNKKLLQKINKLNQI